MKRLAFLLLCLAMFSGCQNSSAPTEAPKPKPAELLTGRAAFQQLYVAARGWAPDTRPYQVQSGVLGTNNGHDGKAVIWNASFGSASMHASKPYSWSGIDSPDAPSRGVNPGTQDSFTPNNTFDIQFLKIDTDKAFEEAQKHGGEKVLKDKPDTPVIYLLDWDSSNNKLVWHVIFGNSRNTAALVVDVDATLGTFLRKE